MDWELAVSVGSGVLIACIVFRKWLWRGLKLPARTALGWGILWALGAAGAPLGANLVNALVLGVLGVPGLGLLWGLTLVTG